MFYIIGVGLGDVKDITVRGLEIVRKAKRVYLESYTSILPENKLQLVGKYKFIAIFNTITHYIIIIRKLFTLF